MPQIWLNKIICVINRILYLYQNKKPLHNQVSYWLSLAAPENSAIKVSFICGTVSVASKYTFIVTPEHP